MNGGTAIFTTSVKEGYYCNCASSYIGKNCEFLSACSKNLCKNNSTCVPLEDNPNAFLCDCLPGYKGDLCDKKIGEKCVDSVDICPKLVFYCATGSYNNIKIKDLCKKTCKNC